MRRALLAVVVALLAVLAGVSLWTLSERRPNVLIVSIDTLRADRLGELRLRSRADARARSPRRQRAPIHTGHDGGTAHAAGPRVAVHRDLSHLPRRARQRTVLRGRRADHARRGAERPRLPDRRLRRRVRPGSPVGDRTGVRHLLRQLRPVEVRAGGRHRRRPAAGGRGRGSRHRVAERAVRPAVPSRGCTCTIRTRPTRRPSRSRRAFRRRCMARTTPRWHSWTRRSAACSTRSARHATRPSWWSPAIMANRLASTRSSSTGSSSTTRSRRCP